LHQCKRNQERTVSKALREVFRTRSERRKIELLTSLHGMGIPTASAILMLTNPRRYGVIDIRVWQLLYAIGSVRKKPDGKAFSFENWYQYLVKLRYHAQELRVPVRHVERSLFEYHKRIAKGRLYQEVAYSK